VPLREIYMYQSFGEMVLGVKGQPILDFRFACFAA
jgi:hypothetical protein